MEYNANPAKRHSTPAPAASAAAAIAALDAIRPGFRYKALYFNAVGEADVIDSYGNVETIQTVVGGIYPLQNCGVQSGGSTTLNERDFIALYD